MDRQTYREKEWAGRGGRGGGREQTYDHKTSSQNYPEDRRGRKLVTIYCCCNKHWFQNTREEYHSSEYLSTIPAPPLSSSTSFPSAASAATAVPSTPPPPTHTHTHYCYPLPPPPSSKSSVLYCYAKLSYYFRGHRNMQAARFRGKDTLDIFIAALFRRLCY